MTRTNFVGSQGNTGGVTPNQGTRQAGNQQMSTTQNSDESIIIRSSSGVTVTTTDTKAAISLQASLQLAIVVVLSITTGNAAQGESVAQELMQRINTEQTNTQRILIENSSTVTVTTTDIDIAANIQLLLQVLLELVARLGL
ncbi:spore coat protein [Bacillus rubiinfantis]|uniref:spore coat protein n=1 Tax=Bacillus rubiinfantis TaxID=1499680 RepID=UPI00069478BD|nr:spore coat protein [Bacillus rubiinfantis]